MSWIDPVNGLLANEECLGAMPYPFILGSAPAEDSPCVSTNINRAKTWFNDFLEDNF
jgi:penicillin-binding protein 1B